MYKIDIGSEPHQSIQIQFEGEIINLEFKFLNNFWIINISFKNKVVYGLKLASKVFILDGHNFPFEIIVDDLDTGLDPYLVDDFSTGRFEVNLTTRSEITSIRGYEVE